MNKTFLISFILVLLVATPSFSLVQSSISIQQSEKKFIFMVSISNREKFDVRFKLSEQARAVHASGLTLEKNADGTTDLGLLAHSTAQIDYEIANPLNANFYVTSENLWVPVLTESAASPTSALHQTFSISAKLLPGFQLIDSATGKTQDELDFVICRCTKYSSSDKRLNIYLLHDEPELAKTVLNHLQGYLTRFESTYGPYPYDQFSVVESADEIGYAFPKMTWIGSQLLHFPFILTTSLPHELLHSWWGNGVFVDYSKGNWCEGLTTFGADYGLLSEPDKAVYRLKAITSYLNYARGDAKNSAGKEIPLDQFISRGEDRALQAIGYDKALMVFVMAEQRVGESVFNAALREFYQKYRYQKAAYADFFAILSQLSGQDFKAFQEFWISSVGLLPKDFIQLKWSATDKHLSWTADSSALMKIPGQPLSFHFQWNQQSDKRLMGRVSDDGIGLRLNFENIETRPVSYAFDPGFLLLRDLNENEKPVTFSQVFAANEFKTLSNDPRFTDNLIAAFPSIKIEGLNHPLDFSFSQIVIVDGEQVHLEKQIQQFLANKQIFINSSQLSFNEKTYDLKEHAFFASLRIQQTTVIVVGLDAKKDSLRWLQRWTHYGSKSVLGLNATAADFQGIWLEPYLQAL